MTDSLTHPRREISPDLTYKRPLLPAAIMSASSAALAGTAVSAAIALIAWATDSRASASTADALRAAVQIWLAAHHGTFRLPGADIGLLPLGLSIVPAFFLLRTGTSLASAVNVEDLGMAGRATLALAGCYAFLVVIACGLAGTDQIGAKPISTMIGAYALAVLAGGAGVVRGSALWRRAFLLLPAYARLVVRAAGIGAGTLLLCGALLAGMALAMDFGQAVELSQGLTAGGLSGFMLFLLCVAYAPNAAVWGAAYICGPGFAVGSDTSVSAFDITLGAVPSFPLLAALPSENHPDSATFPLLAVPLVVGGLMAIFIVRRLDTGDYGHVTPWVAAGWAVVSGVVAGIALGLAASVSRGALGSARLAEVGPSPWQIACAAAGQLVFTGALVAAFLRWKTCRREFSPVGQAE